MQTEDSEVSKENLIQDLRAVVSDAEELLRATASQPGEKISAARERIQTSLKDAQSRLRDAQSRLGEAELNLETEGVLVVNMDGLLSISDLIAFLQQLTACYASIRFFLYRAHSTESRSWSNTLNVPVPELPTVAQPMLLRAILQSPGFLEFLASLNPLKVLCEYLEQRHERLKDIQYRNDAERQKLLLENLLLKNKVLSDSVQLLKETGFTQSEIKEMLSFYIADPVERLDKLSPAAIAALEVRVPKTEDENK